MKKVEIWLKCFGVLVAVFGFYVSQAGQVPWLLRRVSPKYLRGIEGLRKLRTEETLVPSDNGFSELAEIVMIRQKEANPSKDFGTIRVENFALGGAMTYKYKGKRADMLIPVNYDLSDGSGGPQTIGGLRIELEQIRMKNIFQWMAILLFVGIGFLEIPTIIIQVAKEPKIRPQLPPVRRDERA